MAQNLNSLSQLTQCPNKMRAKVRTHGDVVELKAHLAWVYHKSSSSFWRAWGSNMQEKLINSG